MRDSMAPRLHATPPPGGLDPACSALRHVAHVAHPGLRLRGAFGFAMQAAGIALLAAGLTALTLVAVWGVDLLGR